MVNLQFYNTFADIADSAEVAGLYPRQAGAYAYRPYLVVPEIL